MTRHVAPLTLNRINGIWLLQPDLSGWAGGAEFGPTYVAPHCCQASVAGVTHDLLVRHAIPVGGRHESGAQTVRADRLSERSFHPGFRGTLVNVDLSSDPDIGHLNIDKSPELHARAIHLGV